MDGGTGPDTRAGWVDPGRYRPGSKEALVFAILVFVGFAAWFAWSPGMAYRLFGVELPGLPRTDSIPLSLLRVPVSCGALALVGGFVFSRGFYLWGLALTLHGPFVEGLTVYLMYQEGLGLVGGTRGIVGYAVISTGLFVFTIFCYTFLSSVGAGLRLLLARGSRRRGDARGA